MSTVLKKEKSNIIDVLEWDSQFFGFKIAQIGKQTINDYELEEALQFCSQNNIRLLQFKCDAGNRKSILLSEKNGFHFADLRMILSCNLKKNNIPRLIHHNWEFRVASDNDTDQLVGISEDLYVHSRYYFDLNFPREKVKTFYQDWVSKAIRGEFDDLAYVLCIDGCPQAFCTLRFNGNESMIGLVGVHSKYSGKGLGKAVLENSLMKLKDIGINKVSVITQGRNYPAQRLYQRVGFLIEKSQVYYHLWI